MDRKAIVLFLGLAIAFAALPALAALSFGGSTGAESAELARVPVTVIERNASDTPLAFGLEGDGSDCPGKDGVDSTSF